MRAGLSTIQQTLTPEAASVLNQSISEAARRNHGQTTPLHVAATLLASPSGYLRQACIRSHPNSSHPLQCRALELCFSVALERLPTTTTSHPDSSSEPQPPVSNALMAALKRAQAHQRRGCPEQQQQPLLAVKVELEQLIISILDDPSVSRVMREASFSSPAVKAAIEHSLTTTTSTSSNNNLPSSPSPSSPSIHHHRPLPNQQPSPFPFRPAFRPSTLGLPSSPNHMSDLTSSYRNPRLQQQNHHRTAPSPSSGQTPEDDIRKVIEILSRTRKKNPVLVGVTDPNAVMTEALRRIATKELGVDNSSPLSNVEIVSVEDELMKAAAEKTLMSLKLEEIHRVIETQMTTTITAAGLTGVILVLGDLKWLVDYQHPSPPTIGVAGHHQQGVSEAAKLAVVEMGKLLRRFGGGGLDGAANRRRMWVIATATCETYLRCQVYHPTMENEWDLQAVSIAARASLPANFSRLGTNGLLNGSLDSSRTPLKNNIHPALQSLKSSSINPALLSQKTNINPALQSLTMARNSERISSPSLLQSLVLSGPKTTPAPTPKCCPQCMENYKQEVSKLSSSEQKEKSVPEATIQNQLPKWLLNVKASEGKDLETSSMKEKSEELLKKFSEKCQNLHATFHQNSCISAVEGVVKPVVKSSPFSSAGLYTNPLLARQQALHPKPTSEHQQPKQQLGTNLRLEMSSLSSAAAQQPARGSSESTTSPGSPVKTDLVLGQTKTVGEQPDTTMEKAQPAKLVKDFLNCISSDRTQSIKANNIECEKSIMGADADAFKRILKGLTEKVWWQKDAASAVAASVTQCRTGTRRRRAGGAKGDVWLLFSGPDRTGKKKLAVALSELVCGAAPITICLGSRRDCEESEMTFRGKTVLDRIAEAIRRNPLSVIMLQDVDEAEMLLRSSIKRAMDRGRFVDSYGREISLGNIIFILTVSGSNERNTGHGNDELDEDKLATVASGGWQLRITAAERKGGKRRPNWMNDMDDEDDDTAGESPSKQQRRDRSVHVSVPPSLSFDLNEMADAADGSHNSSDLTVDEHEEDRDRSLQTVALSAVSRDLIGLVDDAIAFKPVDFGPIRTTVERTLKTRIRTIVGMKACVSVDSAALEKILGGVWLGKTGLDSWLEKVLVPSMNRMRSSLLPGMESGCVVVRVELDEEESEPRRHGDWLPMTVSVAAV